MNGRSGKGPVVIGGVGGSGTRVVAEILSTFGYYIGSDLNSASDNLLYTLIFKRPKWFYTNRHNRKEIDTGIKLFQKLMLGEGVPSLPEIYFLLRALGSMALSGHNAEGVGKGFWPLKRMQRLLSSKAYDETNYVGWGWKEPNSHLLIENLAGHYDGFKYIHTIRHGLDMAFSGNQQQLYNWGPLYGVQIPDFPSQEPSMSFKYWIKANERVLDLGKQLGNDRLLVINFDNLCISPEAEIRKLVTFLGIEVNGNLFEQALCLPKISSSTGRYKSQDLGIFDKDDVRLLTKFGFSVE